MIEKDTIYKKAVLTFCFDGFSLVSFLASQRDKNVSSWLQWGGKIEDAAYGYALGGHNDLLAKTLALCPKEKQIEVRRYAMRGLARAGHTTTIYQMDDYRSYKADLVMGFAQAGEKDKVNFFLSHDVTLFPWAVRGYASANQKAHLTQLITGTCYYSQAIYEAAKAGYDDLVDDLLSQCGVHLTALTLFNRPGAMASHDDINAYALLNHALSGYVRGRHFNKAVGLLEIGASITHAIFSLDNCSPPSDEVCLAFLVHIKNPTLQTKVFEKINEQRSVIPCFPLLSVADKEIAQGVVAPFEQSCNDICLKIKSVVPQVGCVARL